MDHQTRRSAGRWLMRLAAVAALMTSPVLIGMHWSRADMLLGSAIVFFVISAIGLLISPMKAREAVLAWGAWLFGAVFFVGWSSLYR